MGFWNFSALSFTTQFRPIYNITWPNINLHHFVILDQWFHSSDFQTNFERNFKDKLLGAKNHMWGNGRSIEWWFFSLIQRPRTARSIKNVDQPPQFPRVDPINLDSPADGFALHSDRVEMLIFHSLSVDHLYHHVPPFFLPAVRFHRASRSLSDHEPGVVVYTCHYMMSDIFLQLSADCMSWAV